MEHRYIDIFQSDLKNLKHDHPRIKILPLDIDLTSADSVAYHLGGLIPLSAQEKQSILEAFDASQRMNILSRLITKLSEK